MSALHNVPAVAKTTPSKHGDMTLIQRFGSRASKELIIAFVGPIGCGIKSVIEDTKYRLLERGYEDVVIIKLSDFLEKSIKDNSISIEDREPNASERFYRYRRLQNAGKALRKKTTNRAILSEYAMEQIVVDREKRRDPAEHVDNAAVVIPKRVAYLIDQIKRPEEVTLLRAVYRNLFYLIGVTRVYDHRVLALKKELLKADEIHRLMEIDRLEVSDDGQQLDKTLHLSDIFIRNDATTVEEKAVKINRVLDLIHGDRSITPTEAEQGMYAAFAAGLRSACLSRQVGAALVSKSGEIISTGCNDVPKAGGGLYSASSPGKDMRCVHREEQYCFNDFHKKKLQEEIGGEIGSYLKKLNDDDAKRNLILTEIEKSHLINSIYKNTRLKDLIEFSRAVHAEMDAIITVGRLGGAGLSGATLYTTTFPCHNCARHIVSAGIVKVIYIEPYEKSMARDLHDDAIEFDAENSDKPSSVKVKFLHFEGVSPRQFQSFFKVASRKNKEGIFIKIQPRTAEKTIPEYLDNYQDFEVKAIANLNSEIQSMQENPGIKVVDKPE